MSNDLVPQQPRSNPVSKNLGRIGISLALGLTATSLGVFWYGRYFLNERLSPLVQEQLEKALSRPVQLGKIQRVSLSGVQFGRSQVPATGTQPNFLVVDTLDVQVDLWRYFSDRQIGLDVVAKSPEAYFQQDAKGLYFPLIQPPKDQQQKGLIDLRTVKLQNGSLTLQPYKKDSPPVTITQIQTQSDWKIVDPNKQSVQALAKGKVLVPKLANTSTVPTPDQLRAAVKQASNDEQAEAGALEAETNWDLTLGQGDIKLRSQNLLAAPIQSFLPKIPIKIAQGRIDGDVNFRIRRGDKPLDVQGSLKVRDGTLFVNNVVQAFTNVAGNVQFDGVTTTLQGVSGNYGALALRVDGTHNVTSGFNMDVALEPTDIAETLKSFQAKTTVAIAGEFKATAKIAGKTPLITAAFSSTKPVLVDLIVFKQVQGKAIMQDFESISFKEIKAIPALGGQVQGNGQLRLPKAGSPAETLFALNLTGVTAEKIAEAYETKLPSAVGVISAAVQIYGNVNNLQVLTQFDAPKAAYPAYGEALLAGRVLTLRNTTVQFPQGAVGVSAKWSLDGKRAWQAQLTSTGILLSALGIKDKGSVSGALRLNSPTGSFELAQISAIADLDLPQGLATIADPIVANLSWDGESLTIPVLRVSDYLSAKGRVNLLFNEQKIPNGVASLDLDLRAQDVNVARVRSLIPNLPKGINGLVSFTGKLSGALDQLAIAGSLQINRVKVSQLATAFAPRAVAPTGSLDFDGLVVGAISSPRVSGKLQLVNFGVDRVAFEPFLAGDVSFDLQEGLELDLRGNRDRLAAKLDNRFQPLSFAVQLQEAVATATRSGSLSNRLNVDLKNLPVELIAAIAGQKNIDGTISSQFVVDLGKSPSATGTVTVDRPRFARLQADQLTARVAYANGITSVTDGKLAISIPGNDNQNRPIAGEYKFNLSYNPQANNPLQGAVNIANGRIEDVFTALQWFDFPDIAQGIAPPVYAKADVLPPLKAIGLENSPLYQQLEYFSQVNARIEQQEVVAAERNNNLPPLSNFMGRIDGDVQFVSSKNNGIGFGFDLTGKNWEYGKFAIEDIIAKGKFRDDILALETLRLQSGDRFGQIANARFGALEQSGKVELSNFPIETLRPLGIFDNIPVDVSGNANGTAVISGNVFSPTAKGKLTLADATINRQPLESVSGEFDYDKGRFKFNSVLQVSGPEPLYVSGDVPYRTPFALISPSRNLSLKIDVKNEGLALINIFDQPVRWVSGIGQASLVVSGTITRPQVQGKLLLDQTTLQVAGLPSDITDIKGDVNFDLDRLNSNLTGQFSNGKILATGILAISNPNLITENSPDFANLLTVSAEKLKLNFKDLYEGSANGFVVVRGSALTPVLGGEIALSDGRIIVGGNGEATNGNNEVKLSNGDVKFDQLIVKLRQNVQVTRPPLLNLLAEGDISISGSLHEPRPSGRINIVRGQVNAISARFRLDRAFDNYAEFMPNQGFNPNLNVRVVGAVPELTRIPISSAANDFFNDNNRVSASRLGAQRTLQVQATLRGTALNPDFELRSSPPRTQSEILALIGGGLLQQAGGDPTAALANLAGGTIITFLQDAIGDALNLAEFNLSPTTTIDPNRNTASGLGLAAEAAIDLSRNFSVSVRGVINDPASRPSYTLRYRLNPNTLVRTNTDFQGNNGAAIEFETRF